MTPLFTQPMHHYMDQQKNEQIQCFWCGLMSRHPNAILPGGEHIKKYKDVGAGSFHLTLNNLL